MDKKDIKYVVVIQCDFAKKRCSGFACSNCFFDKQFSFAGYGQDTRYLSIDCGGCDGYGVSARLEHFSKKMMKKTDIKKDEVAIHLASCMVTENHHRDRCPHIDLIKELIQRKGYKNIVEGTYISMATQKGREKGFYKTYDSVEM